MLYYALEYNTLEENPEAKILWETESTSLTETEKLVIPKPNCEYEIVTEAEILADAQKLYDIEALLN